MDYEFVLSFLGCLIAICLAVSMFFGLGFADAILPCEWGFHSDDDFCKYCGHQNVTFCSNCSEPLQGKYCGACGTNSDN